MLVVGLGNPGKKYESTRHNIGFDVVDALAEKYEFPNFQNKFQSEYAEGEIAGEKVKLLKPQTYMNESGIAVGEAAKFYKIDPINILVIHDELDLEVTKMKIKAGGGNGGHNGLKSIDAHIGENYKRMRFGIGHPGIKEMVTSYVLSKFNADEQKLINEEIDFIVKNFKLILESKDNIFLSRFASNFKPKPVSP